MKEIIIFPISKDKREDIQMLTLAVREYLIHYISTSAVYCHRVNISTF